MTRCQSITPNLLVRTVRKRTGCYRHRRAWGLREFAITDPGGHLIAFAERVTPI